MSGGHRWKAGCHHLSNRRYTGHGNPFPSTFGSSQRKRFHLLGEKGLAFHYFSDESGVRLAVIGEGPLVVDGELIDISSKALLKRAFMWSAAWLPC